MAALLAVSLLGNLAAAGWGGVKAYGYFTRPSLVGEANKWLSPTPAVWDAHTSSLVITVQDEVAGETGLPLEHLLKDLGFSSAVVQRIYRTRAVDGTLSADADDFTMSWTYRPDDGLQIVIERT